MSTRVLSMRDDKQIESKLKKFEEIKRNHFKPNGYQCVDSDVMIFLISELQRFYFPSE